MREEEIKYYEAMAEEEAQARQNIIRKLNRGEDITKEDAKKLKNRSYYKIKEHGPKDQTGKPEYAVIPWDAFVYVIRAFEYGAKPEKYKEPFTYKKGIHVSKLVSAAMRHIVEWFYFGIEVDEESGCHPLGLACANLLMILAIMLKHGYDSEFDNRPE